MRTQTVVVIAILIVLAFTLVGTVGILNTNCADQKEARERAVTMSGRIEIVSEQHKFPVNGLCRYTFVLRDKKTGQEFLFIETPYGAALCPIERKEK